MKGYWENKGLNISKFTIDFKRNGTYKMSHIGIIPIKKFYGTYIIEDSIITIDKSRISYVIESDKFVIKPKTKFLHEVELIQIDKNRNEVTNSVKFQVLVDNRK